MNVPRHVTVREWASVLTAGAVFFRRGKFLGLALFLAFRVVFLLLDIRGASRAA